MKLIETLEQWNALSLAEKGYRLWQWQHDVHSMDGFFAWFWAPGKPEICIVTFCEEVQNAALNFRSK